MSEEKRFTYEIEIDKDMIGDEKIGDVMLRLENEFCKDTIGDEEIGDVILRLENEFCKVKAKTVEEMRILKGKRKMIQYLKDHYEDVLSGHLDIMDLQKTLDKMNENLSYASTMRHNQQQQQHVSKDGKKKKKVNQIQKELRKMTQEDSTILKQPAKAGKPKSLYLLDSPKPNSRAPHSDKPASKPHEMTDALEIPQILQISFDVTFHLSAKNGKNAYKEGIFHGSKEYFAECLEIIHTHYDDFESKKPFKNLEDVIIILKYLFARSSTHLNYEDIISGYQKLNEIIDARKEVEFPAVFLGFAELFQRLNRFPQASDAAKKGIEWFENNLSCITYSYPGMPEDLIEETEKEFLIKKFYDICREIPPIPDAICKYSDCLITNKDHHIFPSKNIYRSDPDFKPFYIVICSSQCRIVYHETCWTGIKCQYSYIKLGARTPSEKDFCGTQCLTPDCEGLILKVQIYDSMDYMTRTVEDRKLKEKLGKEASVKKIEKKKRI